MDDRRNDKKKRLAPSRCTSIKKKNLGRLNNFKKKTVTW